jgi:hypothetical protein
MSDKQDSRVLIEFSDIIQSAEKDMQRIPRSTNKDNTKNEGWKVSDLVHFGEV